MIITRLPDEEAKQTENILILAEIRQDGAKDESCSATPRTPKTVPPLLSPNDRDHLKMPEKQVLAPLLQERRTDGWKLFSDTAQVLTSCPCFSEIKTPERAFVSFALMKFKHSTHVWGAGRPQICSS